MPAHTGLSESMNSTIVPLPSFLGLELVDGVHTRFEERWGGGDTMGKVVDTGTIVRYEVRLRRSSSQI